MNKLVMRILNKLNLLEKVNLIGSITLNNKRFSIPVVGKMGFLNLWMSEQWMIELLEIVTPISNGTFIDVGVNTGQTLLKLKSVSTNIKYIGFEPNPTCIYYVNELIRLNDLRDTELVPVGISSETKVGKLFFYDKSMSDSSASTIEDFRPGEKIERAEYIPLYDINSINETLDLNSAGIIKIDVEGGELEVLMSFEANILNSKPILLLEILPVYKIENSRRLQRQNKIEQLFSDWGYSIHRVDKKNEQLINVHEIKEIGIHGDLNSCEYVAVPKIKLDEFRKSCLKKLPAFTS